MLARRAPVYAAFGAIGLLTGIASAQPSLVAIGAAFVVPLVWTLAAPAPSLPGSRVELSTARALEGDAVELRVTLDAGRPAPWVDVELETPERVLLSGERRLVVALAAGEQRTLDYALDCPRWGVFELGELELRSAGNLGMRVLVEARAAELALRVYPRLAELRRLVRPARTRPASGARTARSSGEGIEFSELRPLAPGERARRVNWRASAARGTLLVSDRHPEQSSEIVVFLDSLGGATDATGSTLDHSVRVAATLVAGYLRRRDRVGLLRFGGDLEWVLPGSSARQLYRIVDALLQSEAARLYRWRDTSLIPRRVLPPQSLIVALSPLTDWRVRRALLDLRRRGFDLAVVEVDPTGFALAERERYGDLAWRTWLLDRDRARSRFAAAGIPIARWRPGEAIAAAIEELEARR